MIIKDQKGKEIKVGNTIRFKKHDFCDTYKVEFDKESNQWLGRAVGTRLTHKGCDGEVLLVLDKKNCAKAEIIN